MATEGIIDDEHAEDENPGIWGIAFGTGERYDTPEYTVEAAEAYVRAVRKVLGITEPTGIHPTDPGEDGTETKQNKITTGDVQSFYAKK